MSRLRKIELADIVERLPSVQPFKDSAVDKPQALFVCALGFEQRCLSVPKKLASIDYRADQAVYLQYATNQKDNEANLEPLRELLGTVAGTVEPVQADADDFGNAFRSILANLRHESGSDRPRVTLDISVMSNRLVMRCMKALLEAEVALRVTYAEAEVYHPTKAEYEADPEAWQKDDDVGLEHGVLEIQVFSEYAGHHIDQIPDSLILFPSFKKDRSQAVITHVDPSLHHVSGERIVWLLGDPHLPGDEWRLRAMRDINCLRKKDGRQIEVDTFDYRDALTTLESVYQQRWRDYRLTISPLGSKLQALGTSLFHHMHPEVRIVFSVPKRYNAKNYSERCKGLWGIEFGPLPKLCELLRSVGTLVIENGPRKSGKGP